MRERIILTSKDQLNQSIFKKKHSNNVSFVYNINIISVKLFDFRKRIQIMFTILISFDLKKRIQIAFLLFTITFFLITKIINHSI